MERALFLKTIAVTPILGLRLPASAQLPSSAHLPSSGNPQTTDRTMLVEAHRGYSAKAPENTLSAIEMAILANVDRVEIDLQLSSDGIPVVIHDHSLNRTTDGFGLVRDYSLADLKKLDAGSWMSTAFRNERIPTLEEVFDLCHKRVMLNIDLKTLDAVEALSILIRKWEIEDQLVLTGLVPACVSRIRSNDCFPSMFYESGPKFSQLIEKQEFELAIETGIREARRFGLPGFLFHHSWLNRDIVRQAHLHGLAVNVWGVETHEVFIKMQEAGVDAVMCDDPNIVFANS